MAVATFRSHLAKVDVILLMAIYALNAHSLDLCVGPVALGASHLIVVALKLEVAQVVNLFSKGHRE